MIGQQAASDARLAALRATGLLDAPPESSLDRITALATQALQVPVALISLVDENRQFFLSECGLPEPVAIKRETPLSHSFCQHVAHSGERLIISDAREHPLVRDNLAVRDLNVIAYAGVPIHDAGGAVLGSFCAIDFKPRDWTTTDVQMLTALAAQVSTDFAMRSHSARLADELARQFAVAAERQTMARLHVHDIRTPLSAILLGMDVIKMLGPVSEKQDAYLAMCKRNGEALLSIVNNILDIGEIEQRGIAALHRTPCRPAQAIAAAVEQVNSLALEKKITLEIQRDDSLPRVYADDDKLVRTLVNILANAIKFTKDGGRVSVRAVPDAEKAGSPIRFTVGDTGVGMANAAEIFAEGVRLDPAAPTRRSTGLGLTFCKRIIDAHGGTIWVESAPGEGSTFHFTVPVVEENAQS